MSYGIYIGSNLTADNSVLLGGSGDEPSSHWLVVRPRRKHEAGATITVGVTDRANIPGELSEIPQVPETAKYLAHYYSEYEGFPAPLTNGGLNEHGVAARDIWSPSRRELIQMTKTPQRGPQYSDLSRIVMERARSAREAAEIVGALIDQYGYSTYGGNSHLFADADEGWALVEMAGSAGLWVAERLGPDDVRLFYPGYILAIPHDYAGHPDYMGSPNLISFAVEQGWYDPAAGEPFDVKKVYGEGEGRQRSFRGDTSIADFEAMIRRKAGAVTLQDMMAFVRDPRISLDTTGYGQVAALRHDGRPELRALWAAPTASVTAPFVPYFMGVEDIPAEFSRHRYLTTDEAARFQDPNYAAQEATQYAFRVFKRLLYHTAERPERFLPEVVEALAAFESRMIDELEQVTRIAVTLLEAGEDELARSYLTDYSRTRSLAALDLGNALVNSIEARTKVLYGIRPPSQQVDGERVHCYFEGATFKSR